jgi:hypothetical protein
MSLKTRIITIALATTVLAVSAAGAFAHPYYGNPGSWWWFQHHQHHHHFFGGYPYGGYPYGVCFGTWHGEVCI